MNATNFATTSGLVMNRCRCCFGFRFRLFQ